MQKYFDLKGMTIEASGKIIELLDRFTSDIVGEAITHWEDTHIPRPFNFPTVAEIENALVEAQQRLQIYQEEREKTKEIIPQPKSNRHMQEEFCAISARKLREKGDYPLDRYNDDIRKLKQKWGL